MNSEREIAELTSKIDRLSWEANDAERNREELAKRLEALEATVVRLSAALTPPTTTPPVPRRSPPRSGTAEST